MLLPNTASPHSVGIPYNTWRPGQLETVNWLRTTQFTPDGKPIAKITEQSTGCHPAGERVLLSDGSIKTVEDVTVGDQLLGPDGLPRDVLSLMRGFGTIYRIKSVSGLSFMANADHLLYLTVTPGANKCYAQDVIVSIAEYLTWKKHRKHCYKLTSADGVSTWPSADLPIDPYVLGVMLGNGSMKKMLGLTSMDAECNDAFFAELNKFDAFVSREEHRGLATTYCARNTGKIFEVIDALGMRQSCGDKFIPECYRTASTEQRLAILAGLLDTDGSLQTNCYDYISKSYKLADGVAFLARSVGLAALLRGTYKYCQTGGGGLYYRVSISGDTDKIPCRVPRKMATPRGQKKNVLRSGFTVDYMGEANYYGFTLFGDGLYLLDNFVITHNSGKSGTAIAINDGDDKNYQVIILTHTRNLQHQYEGIFKDCMIHKGKSNYPCVNTANPHEKPNADDCIYMGRLKQCPEYPCPYYASRNASRNATRLSLNYAYWFAMRDIYAPYYLMLDEAHSLSDLVLEHVGATIGEYERARWQLPEFPEIIDPAMALFTDQPAAPQAAIDWLMVAASKMQHWSEHFQCQIAKLEGNAQVEAMTNARVCERIAKKYATTLDGLASQPGEHWFIRTGMDFARRKGVPEHALVIKPLTARFDFAKFFLSSENRWLDETRVAMMSATIGNVSVFAEELGIYPYDERVVPSMWLPEQRPVHILDAPSMGRKSVLKDDKAFDKQADVIAKAIKEQPKTWPGLILVSRKSEVLALAERLAKRGLGKRIYPMVAEDMSYVPTEQQVLDWEQRKEKVPNSIGISASLWQGFDGRAEKILIAAKVPFAALGDPYEKARLAYSQRTFLWRAACTLEQGLGRTRRGYPEDYDTPEKRGGYVAVADENYNRIKSFLSQGLLDSLIGG